MDTSGDNYPLKLESFHNFILSCIILRVQMIPENILSSGTLQELTPSRRMAAAHVRETLSASESEIRGVTLTSFFLSLSLLNLPVSLFNIL